MSEEVTEIMREFTMEHLEELAARSKKNLKELEETMERVMKQ